MSSTTDKSGSSGSPIPFENGQARNGSARSRSRPWAILVGGILVATVLILLGPQPSLRGFATEPFTYRVGERTEWEVRARVPFRQVDDAQTVHRRSQAALAVPPVFRVNRGAIDAAQERAEQLLRALASPMSAATAAARAGLTQQQLQALTQTLSEPVQLTAGVDSVREVAKLLSQTGWLDRDTASQFLFPGGRLIVSSDQGQRETTVDRVDVQQLFAHGGPVHRALQERLRDWPTDAVDGLLKLRATTFTEAGPGLVYDELQTEALREEARQQAGEAVLEFQAGARLMGRGEQITREKLELLQREHQRYRESVPWSARLARAVGALVLVTSVFFSMAFYVWRFEPRLRTRRGAVERLVVTTLVALALALVCHRWNAAYVPAIVAAMVLAVAYGPPFAVLTTLALDLCIAWAVGFGLLEFVVLAGATTGASFVVGVVRSRLQLTAAALAIGAALFLLTWATGFLGGQPIPLILSDSIQRFVLGAAAVLLVSALLPVIEWVYDVTTRFTLLELSDAGHPLLQELARRAPGTYSHSQAVAVAAEQAAKAIGADALLVRVGAYYHDIGKMKKARYFIENNEHAAALHSKLEPAMSARIIIGHVREGLELARKHHLPDPIVDLIAQHHGTTLVEYFYHEARRESERDEDHRTEAEESLFRYPGPKPQTKEAGILMLADAAESASRALDEVTPKRLQDMVETIARRRLVDGQLDECDLTMREIRRVVDALAQALYSAAHARIRYPSQESAEPPEPVLARR